MSSSKQISKGKKYDTGKPDWSLLPYDVLSDVVDVLTFGANKYGKYNWQDLDSPVQRYFSALMRHLTAVMAGEIMDDGDDGTNKPHMACVVANALFLSQLIKEVKDVECQHTHMNVANVDDE